MKLSEIADVRMGYPFRSRLERDPRGDVAVVQMKNISESNQVSTEEAIKVVLPEGKSRHILRPGDLLFRSRGRSYGAAVVPDGIGRAVLAAPLLLIRPRAVPAAPLLLLHRRAVLPAYLCWFINAPATQAQLAAQAEGTSVQMISAEALRALDVPLPSEAAQELIVQVAALAEREQTLMAQIATERDRLITNFLMTHARKASS